MLQKKYVAEEGGKDNQPLWTQEEAIAFESARETIGHMIAICSSLIEEEEIKSVPNTQRIAVLEERQFKLEQERIALHVDSKEAIIKIQHEYGSKIKSYLREGGPCPV